MSGTPPLRHLLGNTRAEILALLCSAPRTVSELAGDLGLTRNAVRGHLAILERDGMARHTPVRQGVGKPTHLYEATIGGRGLLSRAYRPALGALLDALRERIGTEELEGAVRDAGHRLGLTHASAGGDARARVHAAVRVLEELGSVARVEEENGEVVITGQCCPLADLVAEHPEACLLVESVLRGVTGWLVEEWCERSAPPRCRFRMTATPWG